MTEADFHALLIASSFMAVRFGQRVRCTAPAV